MVKSNRGPGGGEMFVSTVGTPEGGTVSLPCWPASLPQHDPNVSQTRRDACLGPDATGRPIMG